jgi:hypothetical protein
MSQAHARAQRRERERRRLDAERPTHAELRLVGPDEQPVPRIPDDWAPPERDPVTGRRTVRIQGRGAAPAPVRRSPTVTRVAARPDRVALWAVMLGLTMAFMAVATARGEVPDAPASPAPHVQTR